MIAALFGLLLAGGVCAIILKIAYQAQKALQSTSYQSMTPYGNETQLIQDKHELGRFGFSQLLGRVNGGTSAISLSFTTMALIGSAALLAGPAVHQGGLSIIGFGLPFIALMYVCVSAGVAEICSAIPTAGSLSHASMLLGGRRWAVRTGWFHAAGHLVMLALMNGGCAYFADGLASWIWRYPSSPLSFWCFAGFFVLTQAAVNLLGSELRGWFQQAGLWVQLATALLVLAGLVWMFWPGGYSPAVLYQFQTYDFDGVVQPGAYLLGLLLMLKLFLGMDGAALGAEETIEPRIRIPWAIYLSTAYTYIVGFVLLAFMALTFGSSAGGNNFQASLGFLPGLAGGEWFVQRAMAGWSGSAFIALLLIGSMWWSGQQSMKVCSRAIFSLGRDAMISYSRTLALVSARSRAPVHAIWASAGLSLGILVLALFLRSEGAFISLLAFAIVFLHIAYAIPIGLRVIRGGKGKRRLLHGGSNNVKSSIWEDAPWQLGKWSMPLNAIAFIWLLVSAILAAVFLDTLAAVAAALILLFITAYSYSPWKKAA